MLLEVFSSLEDSRIYKSYLSPHFLLFGDFSFSSFPTKWGLQRAFKSSGSLSLLGKPETWAACGFQQRPCQVPLAFSSMLQGLVQFLRVEGISGLPFDHMIFIKVSTPDNSSYIYVLAFRSWPLGKTPSQSFCFYKARLQNRHLFFLHICTW